MVVDSFLVKLNNPDAVYSPGSTVSGAVMLTVNGEEYAYAIRVKLSGSAVTQKKLSVGLATRRNHGHRYSFYDGPNYHHHQHHRRPSMYSAKQKLFEYSKLLFGDDNKSETIPIGDHNFPFSFTLPVEPLPPSYEINSQNFITYKLRAYIVKPWYKFNLQTETTRLRVVTPFDLSRMPGAKTPLSVTVSKKFGLFWWMNEPLILTAKTNASGFCLGEELPITVEIDNKSGQKLKDMTVELLREWKLTAKAMGDYWSTWHQAWTSVEIVKIIRRDEGVPPVSTVNWEARLLIPANELPSLDDIACDIIKMGYKLRVTACVDSWFSWDLSVELPVTIGS